MEEKLSNSSIYYHIVLEKMVPQASPAFETEAAQERVWGRHWGVYNDVGTMKAVLMHRPGDELKVMTADKYDPEIEALIDEKEQWYFRSDKAPNIEAMQAEHDGLTKILRDNGVEVVPLAGCSPIDPNAMFTRDMGMVVNGGLIISRMGIVGEKYGTGRRGEEAYIAKTAASIGMPILRTIHGEGLMEGGSFCMLNEKTAVIALSARGNESAAKQIKDVLDVIGVELIEIPLVGYSMHIDSAIVMIDHDKALVNIERLPYWFINRLKDMGIEPVKADYRDASNAVNCLAIKPGKIIMDNLSLRTADLLSKRGMEIIITPYSECRKHGGGIHCSTLPLIRDKN